MRLVLIFVTLIMLLPAKSLKMRMRSSASLRAKMASNVQYRQYPEEKERLQRMNAQKKASERILDFDDEFYLVDVQIGTPGQNVSLVLDTGSSTLWVIDDACISAACNGTCHGGPPKHKFKTCASKTFEKEERDFVMVFCEGYLGTDVVSFAGLVIQEQEFGVATGIAPFYGVQPMDGVFGLAWPDLSLEKVVPPMQNILSELDKPMFTVWLDKRKALSSGGNGGMITFGGFDQEHCAADVNHVKLSSLTYWQFPMIGFSVISDTASAWLGAPYTAVKAIAKEIGAYYDLNTGLYTLPCTGKETEPDLIFTINNVNYSISPEEYLLEVENDTCALAAFALDSGAFEPTWILGDAWIRTYCNVYDIGEKRIGENMHRNQMGRSTLILYVSENESYTLVE